MLPPARTSVMSAGFTFWPSTERLRMSPPATICAAFGSTSEAAAPVTPEMSPTA